MMSFIYDIPKESATAAAFALLLIAFLLVVVWRKDVEQAYLSRRTQATCFLVIILFYLFACWGGDWFHYREMVTEMPFSTFDYMNTSMSQSNLEIPYYYLIHFIKYDYLLFRLIIWGGATLMLYQSRKLLGIDNSVFIYVYVTCSLITTSVSRVILPQSMAILGFSLILYQCYIRNRKSMFLFIIAIALILISLVFHKSALFLAAFIPLSFINLSKTKIRLLLLIYPILIFSLLSVIIFVLRNNSSESSSMINYNSAQGYMDKGVVEMGIPTWIQLILLYYFYFHIFVFIVRSVFNGQYDQWTPVAKKFGTLVFGIMYVSVLFVFSPETNILFNRFLAFAILPSLFMLSNVITHLGHDFRTKYIALLGTVYCLYAISLSILGRILG